MGLKLDYDKAKHQLSRAIEIAEGDTPVPSNWEVTTNRLAEGPSQTLIAGLGAALLAKATNGDVDPLSIKPEDGRPRSFAIRPLAERILVPASRGGPHSAFHLGVRGPQPMNNQPYFRYSHLEDVVRHRAGESLDLLRESLRHLDTMGEGEALQALAAYIRCRMKAEIDYLEVVPQSLSSTPDLKDLVHGLQIFLNPESNIEDRPLRLQAAVGGLVRASGVSVSCQPLNDPSRHAPGDTHVPDHKNPRWVAEVKARPFNQEEAHAFIARTYEYGGITAAWIIAIHPKQKPINQATLSEYAERYGLLAYAIESIGQAVTLLLGHPTGATPAIQQAGQAITLQLQQMNAQANTIKEWVDLFSD